MDDVTETTASRPLRADAQRNRERILAAAAAVFARHGLASTLDQVADEAGVGVGTVYRRFTGREELVQLVFEQRLDDVATRLEQASYADDVSAALDVALHQVIADMAANRGLRELVEAATDPALSALHAVHQRLERAGERIAQRGLDQGAFRPGVRGSDIGVVARCAMTAADMTEDDGWRRYLMVLLDGLRDRPGLAPLPEATISSSSEPFPRR